MLFLYSPPEEINQESTYSSHTEDKVASGQRKEPDGLSRVTRQAGRGRPLGQAGNRKRVSSELIGEGDTPEPGPSRQKGAFGSIQAEPLEERPMGLGWRGADACAVSLGVSAGSRGLGPFGGHD